LFTVKDGGIMQILDVKNGKAVKQQRLEASGEYYASPVCGDGKVYAADDEGRLTVLDADHWDVLHTADFGEPIYATPALVDGRVYLRTKSRLYCFGTN
jgi:outer membrane protein assembly factor BamB